MARALQCPDCGSRHPLDALGGARTFRCDSCRRLLKVPKALQEEVSANGSRSDADATKQLVERRATAPSASVPPGSKVPPSQRGDAVAQQARAHRRSAPAAPTAAAIPRAVRILVWVVAVPLGLLPVVAVGRLTGLLTLDAAADVFIGVGLERFVPPLVILPFWSAVSATIAHLAIEGLGRLRRR